MVQLMGGDVPLYKKAPRAYQSEILQICQRRNAIVRLDTGMGKTFIAIMLMKYLASLPLKDDLHRIMVFIVPTVALVDQQSQAIAEHTSLRTRPYRGDMAVEFWDRMRWQSEFLETDCIVLTGEIFKRVLERAYWPLDQVSLMVFDECHHTIKRHPYNMIMAHYHYYKDNLQPGQCLPQILGLTASPIFNPADPEKKFSELEANLDAILVNVRDEKIEKEGYVQKPIERPLYYSREWAGVAGSDFEAWLEDLEIWEHVKEDKIRDRIANVKKTLGGLAADVYITNWLWSLCDPTATKSSLLAIRQSGRIPEVDHLCLRMHAILNNMTHYDLRQVSDKVRTLVLELKKYENQPDFHAIIFVEQRHHAQALAMILSKAQALQTFIRPMYFVGHGASGEERLASEGMVAKKQRQTVDQFRNGDVNLLVATNVAEEGLDFQACNLIVRFDSMTTLKGYIQSRGRARKKDSEFVVMLERDSPEEMRWRKYVGAEKQLDKLYDERAPGEEPDEPELENTPRWTVPKTGAVLTYGSAIALLDEVCSLIPTDAYSPPSRPRYKLHGAAPGPWWTQVFLPMMPVLPPDMREIKGPEIRTMKGSKQAVAFETCKILHSLGIIDDHLNPLREGKGDLARDADDEPIDRTVLPMHTDVDMINVFGNVWSENKPTTWLNEIRIVSPEGKEDRFGLICAERLDLEGPLVMHEPGTQFSVYVRSMKQFRWSEEKRAESLAKFDKFTRWIITQTINRKLIQGPLLYLLTPLRQTFSGSFDVDWYALDNPYSNIESLDQIKVGNVVLSPWLFLRKHVFTVHAIRKDLNPKNMPRITGLTKRGHIFDRTGSFGEAIIALLDYENVDVTGLDFGEPMLHLRPWFSVRNNLNPIKAHKNSPKAATAPSRGGTGAEPMQQDHENGEDDAVLEDAPLQPWELPDWKWREYKTARHEVDEEERDMIDPETSIEALNPLPPGETTASCKNVTNAFVLPWSLCKISNIAIGVWNAFSWLPSLLRAIHDQARTQRAMRSLGLPRLQFPLVTQALTLPMCCTGKDYQTLETIGDSALKLAVTVVVYNRYTAKDEGGLSTRRMNSIDNQHLRNKAIRKGLQNHLFTEFFRMRTWVPPTLENGTISEDGLTIRRTIPRRALSDCVESLLGAAYLSGGFEAVLRTGDALGLCFGGTTPWHERYQLTEDVMELPAGRLLAPLEEQLGYKFKHGQLLMQALTHRSFASGSTHCQEREEFLGDAVLDNFVIDRLSRRFPTATPSHLTRLRSVLVSNSALGYLALKVLGLHRHILHATPLLGQHFERALQEAQLFVHEDFVHDIWLFDPPKPAADAVEGIIGSMFVDCGWRVEPVFEVLDRIFEDLFKLLPTKESAPRDPTSRLRLYLQHRKCKDLVIQSAPRPDIHLPAIVTVIWHGKELTKVSHHSQASAKQLASKAGLAKLHQMSEAEIGLVCTCHDDLAERIGDLKAWKKEAHAVLKAANELPIDRDPEREIDEVMAEDQDARAEAEKDEAERELEETMHKTYGYNVHEDAELMEANALRNANEEGEEESGGISLASNPRGLLIYPTLPTKATASLMPVQEKGHTSTSPATKNGVARANYASEEDSEDDEDDEDEDLVITSS